MSFIIRPDSDEDSQRPWLQPRSSNQTRDPISSLICQLCALRASVVIFTGQ
jgi:hypothetical protein